MTYREFLENKIELAPLSGIKDRILFGNATGLGMPSVELNPDYFPGRRGLSGGGGRRGGHADAV